MKITELIFFDPSLQLFDQSSEFQVWYAANLTAPDRTINYDVSIGSFTTTLKIDKLMEMITPTFNIADNE